MTTAIPQTALARALGIITKQVQFEAGRVNFLPRQVAVIGQGSSVAVYSTDKKQVFGANEVGTTYGFGCPLHLAVTELLPETGNGLAGISVVVFPLQDDGGGAASLGDITATGTQVGTASYRVNMNGILSEPFTIVDGDIGTDIEDAITDAINANIAMPMIAVVDGIGNKSDLTSKWKGVSANDIVVSVEGPDNGITFAITQPAGGAANPDVDVALTQFGNVWYTDVINCLESTDTVNMDKIEAVNEGRWSPLFRKPFISVVGSTETDVATAIAVPEARKATDRTNAQMVAPGSINLPLQIAAAAVRQIAQRANNNPPRNYGGLKMSTLTPGTDAEQWDFNQKDTAFKGGSGSTEVVDGVVQLDNIITMFHPTGDPQPIYRYYRDIVILQNVLFNLEILYSTDPWGSAILVPDGEQVNNTAAVHPIDARIAQSSLAQNMALLGFISDPGFTTANQTAAIDDQNPKRLNTTFPIKISGTDDQRSVDVLANFFFGEASL